MKIATKLAREFDRRATPKLMAKLVVAAIQAQHRAYKPYSKFAVGCALLGVDGRIYSGCNIEAANFDAAHGEETAIGAMVMNGCKSFTLILCVGSLKDQVPTICPSCGKCRQIIREYGTEMGLAVEGDLNDPGSLKFASLDDMLPSSFGPENLDIETPKASRPRRRSK
jgi:cytidine deaminase